MTNEIRIAAELAMRRLQAQTGADHHAIAQAFEPLMAAIASAQKRTVQYETKG